MSEYVTIMEDQDSIILTLYVESEELMEIGEMLREINPNAYMNGENWNILLDAYLEANAPYLLDDMDSDPEAGLYTAIYPLNKENRKKAEQFKDLLMSFVAEPGILCEFVSERGRMIDWD